MVVSCISASTAKTKLHGLWRKVKNLCRAASYISVGDQNVSEAELREIANKFASATCSTDVSTVITSHTVSAIVKEKLKGPDLEVVRLEVVK